MSRIRSKRAAEAPAAGEYVLVGRHRLPPAEWFLARVLWADAADILTEHSYTGNTFRQTLSMHDVIAWGQLRELRLLQEEAAKIVDDLRAEVRRAEAALGSARDALEARLERFFDEHGPVKADVA